jgi:1-acyl-sn-glycerol-3-phosphate acyltransferase
VLNDGDLFGIYPEGTRSPDGRLYKGKTGVARIALASGAQVIPVAMIGTRDVNPIGTWFPRPGKVRVKVGDPIYPIEFVNNRGLERDSYEAIRALTDHIMRQLQQLSGQEYVDVYAAEVKKALAEGGDSSPHNP